MIAQLPIDTRLTLVAACKYTYSWPALGSQRYDAKNDLLPVGDEKWALARTTQSPGHRHRLNL